MKMAFGVSRAPDDQAQKRRVFSLGRPRNLEQALAFPLSFGVDNGLSILI
jgi:hypothetical protein